MQSNRVVGLWGLCVCLGFALIAGCGGGAGKPKSGTGGAGGHGDASVSDGPRADVAPDAPVERVCPANAPKGNTDLGQDCSCDSECGSGVCANGVCCSTACSGKCMACDLPGSEGTCAAVPAGVKPRDLGQCVKTLEATCDLDGTCDGAGACRKFELGTVCSGGTCAPGDGLTGVNICDGKGTCRLGPDESCVPYACGGGKCLTSCTSPADCSAGNLCARGTCGPLPTGRGPCTADADCESGFCADGVCCNVGCKGECVSCNQVGYAGTCRPLGAGQPHASCMAQPKATCGMTGVCDGFGMCAFYPPETTCIAPKCAGNETLNTAGTCDGQGVCQAPGQITCAPSMCLNGTCMETCTTDAQCVPPATCVSGSCGKKAMGSSCSAATQCMSGNCVDGVCCDTACTGACQSCSLQSSLGQCKNVAKNAADPHGKCKDAGAASCALNGKCDGAGACQKYAPDTVCGAETCGGGAYTPPSTCNASGQCIPPGGWTCYPFTCNGTKCYSSCTQNSQCVAPNSCVNGSCGPKPLGAKCSKANECQAAPDGKQYCSQGVCCTGTCSTTCQACNLAGSLGTCATVANGVADPQGKCATTAVGTCGTNGKCRGGVCDVYHTNDLCKAASCSNTSTSLLASYCDGRGGACPGQGTNGCGNYVCDTGTGSCKGSCTSNADCISPNTCNNGSCGKKNNGSACTAGNQCLSGNCPGEGVCCDTTCADATNGTCLSCKVTGKLGTCSPIPAAGADTKGRCVATAQTTCGLSGTCDGTGKCGFWDTSTGCRNQSCTGSTQTNAAKCDGKGACAAVSTGACDPYLCGPTACKTTCTGNGDCTTGVICNMQTNQCGVTLQNGKACKVGADCSSGNCVKNATTDTSGICCNTACTGGCESCGSGTCNPIAAGMAPRVVTPAMCGASAGATGGCGNTGKCDGNRACQQATACNDGNACTTSDVCTGVTCGGTAKVCTAKDGCHTAGVCAAATGLCSDPVAPEGTTCDDNNMCTASSTCVAGVCTAGTAVTTCTALDQCHMAGTCTAATGQCSNPVKTGTPACDDGNKCTTGEKCSAGGSCTGGTLPDTGKCATPDQCHTVGTCDPATGLCVNPAKPNGTSCSDGDLCTTDTCQAGVCTPGTPKVCAAMGACHVAGVCTPATGVCTNPAAPDGTTCSDNNACTIADTCKTGVCTAGTAKVCAASDQCHVAGVCAPATGLCSNPPATNGLACNDGSACTSGDSCQGGTCTGTAKLCASSGVCHVAGICDPATGTCSDPAAPNGTTCTDSNACTIGDSCQSGACVPGAPKTCPTPTACHTAGTCDTGTGVCSNPTAANGATCTDNNACTVGDSCQAGACVAGPPKTCVASGAACHVAGTCDSTTGNCSDPPATDGTTCNDNNACTTGDKCTGGTCGGTMVPCNSPPVCHKVTTCSGNGVCNYPIDDTASCQGGMCVGGDCVPMSGTGGATPPSGTVGAGI